MPLPSHSDPTAPTPTHFSLAGKVAAVTGGARGIGLSAARGLAEAGASVAILYSTSSSAPQTAATLAASTGQDVRAYRADVRTSTSITAVLNQIRADFGRLDVVVANAGITEHGAALDADDEAWRAVMAVNVDGAFWTARAAGRIFEEQGRGALIFTASVSAALVNVPQRQAGYNASKAAVVQLARSLAVEWAGFARVNCVSPGFVETDSECRSVLFYLGRDMADSGVFQ